MKVARKSRIAQIVAATVRQKNRAVSAAAEEALKVANQLVPVAEGDLKSTLEVIDEGAGQAEFKAGGNSKISDGKFVDYENDLEFGTYKQAPQPYFRPGVAAGRKRMKAEMKIPGK